MAEKKVLVSSVLVFLITFFMGAAGLGLPTRTLANFQQPLTPEPTKLPAVHPSASTSNPSENDLAIQTAFDAAVQQNQSLILGLLIYDPFIVNIQYSQDGATALVWVGLRDAQTGEVLATEPGLSIARNPTHGPSALASSWAITLQAESTFTDQIRALPADLLTPDIQSRFLNASSLATLSAPPVYAGYKLPWAAGLSKHMTNSIGHVISISNGLTSCPTSCRYAFDFADGTMFSLLAAKGGTVKQYRTTCANNQSKCTNYLILEDPSTNPTTYQVYYHMAYDSLSPRLRQIGTPVLQGEYIGNADNTGYSTGSHLHFHVFVAYSGQTDFSWGNSQDITFDDVTTNGGRPRMCTEAREHPELGSQCLPNDLYTSGNIPTDPPSGTLDLPTVRQMITTSTMWVQGTAKDDIEVMRIQVLANYDGTWKSIDDIQPTNPYGKSVDLCAAGIPDGPFALTVRIYDREGSQAPGMPVLPLIKNYACGKTGAVAPKSVQLLFPNTNAVPPLPFKISAAAVDADDGPVAQVDFYWHGPDWSKPWVKLTSDTNSSDGWNYTIDPALYGAIPGSALYVQAISKTGGVKGTAVWDLTPDLETPISQLSPLPAQSNTTILPLNWTVPDFQTNIAYFELQYQENKNDGSGWTAWQNWTAKPIPGDQRSTWFPGTSGSSYNFRLRGVSQSNRVEVYPDQPEAATTLAKNCIPENTANKGQTQANAVPLKRSQTTLPYNFCKSTQSGAGDVNWVSFDAKAGENLMMVFSPKNNGTASGAAFLITLYQGSTKLATWQSADYGVRMAQGWAAATSGTYTLEIRPLQPEMFGTDLRYQVWLGLGNITYLPAINR